MAHFEDVEVVAIMPATGKAYAHALGSDYVVYCHMPLGENQEMTWQRVGSGPYCWGKRSCLKPIRDIYAGKFIIKAWVE